MTQRSRARRATSALYFACFATALTLALVIDSATAFAQTRRMAWDENSSSTVQGFAVTVDGVRTDYGLSPRQADGSCGCSVPLPFTTGKHTLVVSAYNAAGETSAAPFLIGPTASAGGPYSGATGASLAVSGAGSVDAAGVRLTSYAWSWGDGTSTTTASTPGASHAYASAGTFTIRLTVTDEFGVSATSSTTAAITLAAQPPGAPASPSPSSGATGVGLTPTLAWNASGATTYDVQFGTTSPPPQAASGRSSASYSPATLAADTIYYWRIVARNAAGATTGPIWAFRTAPSSTTGGADIVIHASDVAAGQLHGGWSKASDSTSPGGVKLATPDRGQSHTNAPLAAPADYVDVTFDANAGTPYTLWLRLRALSDSKFNDSVWVQFSDALVRGTAAYRLGSTSALLVNLATSQAASSLRNWGWQNGAYWLSQSATVTFAGSGTHTLRIQVREDGVQFDQIVLSPDTYLNTPPGPVNNDSTIVTAGQGSGSGGSTPPSGDVVVYASDVGAVQIHGAWSKAGDSTSPSGVKLVTPNNGRSNTNGPLPSPVDYVDVTFAADAGTPYTLWLRLRALNDDKYNDSVWVQFSDALVNGASAYRLSSTSGLLVNLATSQRADSLNGWGWQNGAYWLSQSATVTFATSGTHTLRIQIREDGVQLDQVVLSPSTYRATPPGPETGDRTIVSR